MTREFLEQIENISNEIDSLQTRLDKIENKECRIIQDSVKGSSTGYPYIKHNCVIEGVEVPKNKNLKHKYKKLIKSKKYKLEKMKLQLEYELNYIDDSEIRDIIRYRYNDNMTWLQIMFKMNYASESTAKMKIKRFFKKL